MPRTRRPLLLLLLAVLALCAPRAGATWSIILVDTATGEVGIAAATCLESLDLRKLLPVMVVGKGAGVAQSQIDNGATNRKKIFEQLQLGTPPAQIIEIALQGDPFKKSRQYGIADLTPDAAGYTGPVAFAYKQDVHGSFGSIVYAIQGNILTGAPVIDAALQAVMLTPGVLADRLMAGMEAAAAMGGDGRCSCSVQDPTGCGAPPAGGFEKSAHIGFLMVSRIGDTDGGCNGLGCATGDYWLDLNVAGQLADDPDPVVQLKAAYAQFRLAAQGHPDGLQSQAAFDHDEVLGAGEDTRRLHVALHDLDGTPLAQGGATLTVAHAPGSAGLSQLLSVEDHGDGTYTLELLAGRGFGTDLLAVRAEDGTLAATLYPYPALLHRPALQAGAASLPAGGGTLAFDLLGPSSAAGREVALLLSAGGTAPGVLLPGGQLLPLQPDRLYALSPQLPALGALHGSPASLDALGRARVLFAPPAGSLLPLLGQRIHAAFATLRPADFCSNAVGFDITP